MAWLRGWRRAKNVGDANAVKRLLHAWSYIGKRKRPVRASHPPSQFQDLFNDWNRNHLDVLQVNHNIKVSDILFDTSTDAVIELVGVF
jgi:hypothetical protein